MGQQQSTRKPARRLARPSSTPRQAPRPARYDPYKNQWNDDGSMFYWLRACREDEGYKNQPECFKTRKAMPWPFPRNHYKLTPAQRRQKIFTKIDCKYDNLRSKPACNKLLKRVNYDAKTRKRKVAELQRMRQRVQARK